MFHSTGTDLLSEVHRATQRLLRSVRPLGDADGMRNLVVRAATGAETSVSASPAERTARIQAGAHTSAADLANLAGRWRAEGRASSLSLAAALLPWGASGGLDGAGATSE
ncbi:hypothetical protein [Amycolatopsis sp. WGS_07]|uniref:hypothetical protein n=1 Tax=Amycolatopsis sp. WGS_07 TaxID=3076764 RepID=UPI003873C6D0